MKSTSASFFKKIAITEVLNGVPHGVALLDKKLKIVEMNSFLELLSGFSTADARGVYFDFILRSNIDDKGKALKELLQTGEFLSESGNIITQHHKKIPIHFTVSPLKDEAGLAAGLFMFLEDISSLQSFDKKRQNMDGVDGILGHSPKMLEMFELLPVLARTDASVLITGETGTGKDVIAEAIHKSSGRSRHPFIKVNCGALPESLLESELFGHVRGAFTGAVKDKPGLFRLAQDGTIFLTEIGDLPLPLQVKLLSVLDDKEFFPVGGAKKVKVNVRVIAATHRPLRDLVREGKFRVDLFYRLNVLRLHMPPLRDRDGDIRLLLDFFRRGFNSSLNKSLQGYSVKALEILTRYDYPGIVRELRNIVEYAVNICRAGEIQEECLPKYLFTAEAGKHRQLEEEAAPSKVELPPPPPLDTPQGKAPTPPRPGWNDVEREMILDAMKKTLGNRSKAARILGLGRTTLWRKLKNYNLV